jgi:hypothetical protein
LRNARPPETLAGPAILRGFSLIVDKAPLRSVAMMSWKPEAVAYPREMKKPISAEARKQLETIKFRDPYRTDGVQSFGEKRAIRRIIGRF